MKLTKAQADILSVLKLRPDGAPGIADMLRDTGYAATTDSVRRCLHRLQAHGLVEWDANDWGHIRWRLTPAGLSALREGRDG